MIHFSRYYFLCNKWLAVDEDDGLIDRIIPVAGKEEITGFNHLFFSRAKKNLSEDHLWLSVVSRPSRSHFTRLQRLACCFLLLFSTMIANAMWYGVAETNEGDFSFQLGPFTVSASVILVSIFGSLTVFPVNLLVVQLFRKSRPKEFDPDEDLPGNKNKAGEEKKPTSKKKSLKAWLKQKYWFPYWGSYIAWALTILTNITACIFIFSYSLYWGKKKADEWLSSLLISTVQSVILVQPIKVGSG